MVAVIQSQILITIEQSPSPLIVNPSDKITHGDRKIAFPEDILSELIPSRDSWVDVWTDGETENGSRMRIAFRIFGRRVISVAHTHIFPPEKEMVQS